MLDIKFIRENKDVVAMGAKKKHIDINLDELVALDDKRREIMTSMETKRAEQNAFSEKIAKAATPEERQTMIAEMKVVKDAFQKEEETLKEILGKWQALMVQVPNIPDMTVPEGESDKQNVEVKTWGELPKFDFEPKDHIDLMNALNMVDTERGAKIAGFRGYILKNDAVLLNFALWQYVMETFTAKGFEPFMVPSVVRRDLLVGTGYLPQGEEDLYKTQDSTYLVGTGEVPTMGYYADEVIDKKDLPKKMLAFSTCFRREAGSHGKDTKGIFRVHEFFKFEQVVLCEASHQTSVTFHEELTKNADRKSVV